MAMPAALARYHRSKNAAAPARRSITKSPKFLKAQARVKGLARSARTVAKEAEIELPMMTLVGAAVPALYTRYSGKSLPTVGNIDPQLLAGGLLIGLSMALKGSTRRRVAAIGAGCAAPAVSRAIAVGTIKVGEDDETAGDDDETGADDDETGAI